CTCDGIKPSAR
ncbi:methyl-accepting chemotaxis (MCP) signaling domain protein, partial [Vibrio parahaemolyticus EKP-028]